MINHELWPTAMQFAMQRTILRIRYAYCLAVQVQTTILTLFGWNCVCEPLWPNGEGTGLLNQGLWVRVPPRVVSIIFFFFLFPKVVLDLGCGTGILSLFCAKLGNTKKVGGDLVILIIQNCVYRCMQ